MLEPIITQLQNKLYESVFDNLKELLASNSSTFNLATTRGSLQPKESAFDDLITAAAQRYNLDLSLLKAVVQAESNFSAGCFYGWSERINATYGWNCSPVGRY